jgi:hypothetical protein
MKILVRKTGKSPVYKMGKINYEPMSWQKTVEITAENIDKPLSYTDENGKLQSKDKTQIHWSGTKLKDTPYILTAAEIEKIINMEVKARLKENDLLADILIDDKNFADLKIKVLELKTEISNNVDAIKNKYLFSEDIL